MAVLWWLLSHSDWIVSLTTAIGVELIARRKWYGWVFGLCNQAVWLTFIFSKGQYGLLPLNIMMIVLNIRGLVIWLRYKDLQKPMKNITCPTILIHPDAKAPARSKDEAMGHDICCVAGVEHLQDPSAWDPNQLKAWERMKETGQVVLQRGESFLFRTGFAQAIAPGYGCLLWDRSGMGAIKRVGRLAGVIDEDYRGEWMVRLVNFSNDTVIIKVGDKIVQGVYQERVAADCPVVDSLPESSRGTAGFGSTDQPR
jgi:dUTP pyrophosphatase